MNTISNFNINQQINYQKNLRNNNPQQNNNVNFKGLNPLKHIAPRALLRTKDANMEISDLCVNIGWYIGKTPGEIGYLIKNDSLNKINFFEKLATKFYNNNYKFKDKPKENNKHVIDIYKSVKNISKEHFQVLDNIEAPMEDLSKIFKAAKNNKKSLTFARKVNDAISQGASKEEKKYTIISDLLESPNANEYVNNFDHYKSFIMLHKSDENAVKKLDSLVKHGNYNVKKYNIKLANEKIFTYNFAETPILNKETLKENYTSEGHKLLENLIEYFKPSKESIKAGNDVDILAMYKSTNKSNLQTRIGILETFSSSQLYNSCLKEKNENLSNLNKLFNIIDNDKYAQKAFFKLSNKNLRGFENPKDYVELFENVEAKKLDIFHENAVKILNQTKESKNSNTSYIEILNKEIENPFFMTPQTKDLYEMDIESGYRKKESIFSKTYKMLKNKKNQICYKYASDPKNLVSTSAKIESEKALADIAKAAETQKATEAPEVSKTVLELQEGVPTIRVLEEGERVPLVIEEEELMTAKKAAKAIAENQSQKLPRSLEELKALAKNDSTLEVVEHENGSIILKQKNAETGFSEADYVFNKNMEPIASKEYICDSNGNVAKEIIRDKENNVASIYEYKYDELNRPVQELYSNANGLPQGAEEYIYIGSAKEPASINSAEFGYEFDANNVLIRKQTTEYENGIKTKLLDERMDGMTELTFDSKGNIIKEAIADVEGNVLEVREFEPISAEAAKTPAAVETTEAVIAENEAATTKPARKRILNRVVPKAPNAKKLAVINDVNNIIEKKLGSKTLNDQKHDYAVGATKMRLQILPEIFESIKDTRKAERAAGKTKMSVANKDAVELYNKINGRNKKLVNYMLKKRNADGTRTFGIKDIINTIDSTEKQIRTEKAANKDFKAADAKLIYNNLLNTQIEQYGKLQKTKKK